MDSLNAMERAALDAADDTTEPLGPPITVQVDLDRAEVIPGEPGLYEGLTITSWTHDG